MMDPEQHAPIEVHITPANIRRKLLGDRKKSKNVCQVTLSMIVLYYSIGVTFVVFNKLYPNDDIASIEQLISNRSLATFHLSGNFSEWLATNVKYNNVINGNDTHMEIDVFGRNGKPTNVSTSTLYRWLHERNSINNDSCLSSVELGIWPNLIFVDERLFFSVEIIEIDVNSYVHFQIENYKMVRLPTKITIRFKEITSSSGSVNQKYQLTDIDSSPSSAACFYVYLNYDLVVKMTKYFH